MEFKEGSFMFIFICQGIDTETYLLPILTARVIVKTFKRTVMDLGA